jgi:hypothetical protein
MDGNPSGLRIIGTTSVELRAGRAYPSAIGEDATNTDEIGVSREQRAGFCSLFSTPELPLMTAANAANSAPKPLILFTGAP